MDKVSAYKGRYTLDNLMNRNGVPVVEIPRPHRIPQLLTNARAYVFRINNRDRHELFHLPLLTSNLFVVNVLPILMDERSVATWSFPSIDDVPFYKWHLFDSLLVYHILTEVVERRGMDGVGRYELKLNRGPRFQDLDLVGFSTTARLPGPTFDGTYAKLCRSLDSPQWCKLEDTVQADQLVDAPRLPRSASALAGVVAR